ncbi:facilitated trehalose transporter Tret1-like [Ochlerotatus camptorhynchus]|uniref:facilitated trehalose transporter Tret1-like n=1 Tax=Ochlerotatus camptorhynchus TaxID=644619 RepID=UPI0031D59FE3
MAFLQLFRKYRNEYWATLAATLSIQMVVLTNAWSSPAIPKLMEDDSPIPITADEGSWVVAIQAIGAVFGPLITSAGVDRIGRKWTLLSTAIPVVTGWVLVGVGDSVGYLYAARFLFGVAYGTAYSVLPIYLGEIASDAIRGSAGTMITVLAKKGFLVVYCIGPYLEYKTLAWVLMFGPAIFLLCFVWMPESPYYLLGKNKDEQAEKSLAWFRRSTKVSEELAIMKASVERSNQEKGSFKELLNPVYRNNMRIVFILVFSMQFTGILAILGYAQTIFEKIPTNMKPEEMSIVLGAVQLKAVLVPAILVDRMGRRPLLLLSTAGTTLGLLVCSIYFAIADDDYRGNLGWIAFIALLFYIVSFGMGLATVSFAVLTELFPKNIRAHANATFSISSALVVFVIVKLFQMALDNVGPYLPFGVFALSGAIGFVLIYIYIPETKGKSLDEVQRIVAGVREKS